MSALCQLHLPQQWLNLRNSTVIKEKQQIFSTQASKKRWPINKPEFNSALQNGFTLKWKLSILLSAPEGFHTFCGKKLVKFNCKSHF